MQNSILGKQLLFLTAHPDDETFLAAGTIKANTNAGGKNLLYCASHGEKGTAYLNTPISESELKEIRKQELSEVAHLLNIHSVHLSNFADSKIEQYTEEIKKEVLHFAQTITHKTKPDYIISFGLDGATGHTDHIAIAKVAMDVSKKLDIPLLHFYIPPHPLFDLWTQYMAPKRLNGKYSDALLTISQVPRDSDSAVHVKVEKEIKLKALQTYKTQFKGLNPYNIFPEDLAEHVLQNEYFLLCQS